MYLKSGKDSFCRVERQTLGNSQRISKGLKKRRQSNHVWRLTYVRVCVCVCVGRNWGKMSGIIIDASTTVD